MTRERVISNVECGNLNAGLVRYMNEVYHLERSLDKLNMRLENNSELEKEREKEKLTSEQIQKISDIITKLTDRLRTLQGHEYKIKILNNIIFPAMANLTFFFDSTSNYPELESKFKSDIMDLLGIKRLNPKQSDYAFMFRDLIEGVLKMGTRNLLVTDKPSPFDYPIRLAHILLEVISLRLIGPKILDSNSTSAIVHGDIARAKAWTEMLALRVADLYDFKILYKGIEGLPEDKYGGTEEERLNAFRDHAKSSGKFPHRTFKKSEDNRKLIEQESNLSTYNWYEEVKVLLKKD